MIKTSLGDEVRSCLAGGEIRLPQTDTGTSTWVRVRRKVKQWQSLARKYQRSGLSPSEVEMLMQELKGNKTKADLILELTVRSEDLKDASSEVRLFMDQLLEDLAVKYPPQTKTNWGGEKKILAAATHSKKAKPLPLAVQIERSLTKSKKKPGAERLTKQVSEHLGTVVELAQARENLTAEAVAAMVAQPDKIFAYWEQCMQTEIKRLKTRPQSPFQSLKIRIFGSD